MSKRRAELTVAAVEIENSLSALSRAFGVYMKHFNDLSQAAYGKGGFNQQLELNERIGPDRLSSLIVQRLRALGLQTVLDHARDSETVTEAWVDAFMERMVRVDMGEQE